MRKFLSSPDTAWAADIARRNIHGGALPEDLDRMKELHDGPYGQESYMMEGAPEENYFSDNPAALVGEAASSAADRAK